MNHEINEGGPAFPVPGLHRDESFNGISVRDYMIASIVPPEEIPHNFALAFVGEKPSSKGLTGIETARAVHLWAAEVRAAWCVVQADAIMKARGLKL